MPPRLVGRPSELRRSHSIHQCLASVAQMRHSVESPEVGGDRRGVGWGKVNSAQWRARSTPARRSSVVQTPVKPLALSRGSGGCNWDEDLGCLRETRCCSSSRIHLRRATCWRTSRFVRNRSPA